MDSNPAADIAELRRALERCCEELSGTIDEALGEERPEGEPSVPGWRPLVLASIPGLDQLVSIVSPPLRIIAALLQTLASLLQLLASVLIGVADPFRALILAAYELLRDIINDLINTGAYLYADAPGIIPREVPLSESGIYLEPGRDFRAGQALEPPPIVPDGFQKWAGRFVASFDDPGDLNRPVITEGAPVQAVFLVVATPSLEALRQALYLLGRLINVDAFEQAFERYRRGSADPRRSQARSASVKPDWEAARLRDLFPQLQGLLQIPETLRGLLLAVNDLTTLLKNLASAMQDKAKLLLKLAEAVQSIIELLEALKTSGLYALPVATQGGIPALKEAFLKAPNRPPGGYIGGVCLLAAGPNLAKASLLWELLGLGTVMDAMEGELTLKELGERVRQGALGPAVASVEQAMQGGKEAVEQFWDKTQENADAFVEALREAGPGFAAAVGRTPEELVEIGRRARATGVEILEQAEVLAPLPENVRENIARGIAETQRARRRASRSIAMGLGTPGPDPLLPESSEGEEGESSEGGSTGEEESS